MSNSAPTDVPELPSQPAAAARAAPAHPSDSKAAGARASEASDSRKLQPTKSDVPILEQPKLAAAQKKSAPTSPQLQPVPSASIGSDLPESAVPVQSFGSAKLPRLVVYEYEGKKIHRHHLRPAPRQEKLRTMLKDLFKRHPHDETHASHSPAPLHLHLGLSHHEEDSVPNSRVSSRSNSRASSPDTAAMTRPFKKSDSAEVDQDAADAVRFANDKSQPLSLLNTLAQRLRSSDANPDELLNEALRKQNMAADPKLADRYGQCSSVIGKGSFGVVKLAQRVDPQNKNRQFMYAVKEFNPSKGKESESSYLKRLVSEFYLASSLHHANIIQTIDLLRDSNNKYCGVMEYCAGGDLYSLIVVAGKLETIEADCFFKQIMRAIAYMHDIGIAHRDLKPENVLLTSRGCCKITDFGNTECFRGAGEKTVHLSTTVAGSGPYIAPEEYTKQAFDPRAVDIWAAGMIYMAMMTGRHLWHEAKPSDEFYTRYLRGRKEEQGYEPIERLKMPKRRNVIYSVLDPVASRRLTAKQVLNSEWGRGVCVCPAGLGEP